VQAVDACPGFAAVGGFVDAAVFVAIWALLVLDVFDLPAVDAAGGTRGRRRNLGGAIGEGHFDLLVLLAAPHLELHFVAGLVGADFADQLFVAVDGLGADGRHQIAGFESRFTGGAVFDDVCDPHGVVGVFAVDAGVNAGLRVATGSAALALALT